MVKSYWYYRATSKTGSGHPFGGNSELVTTGIMESEDIFFPLVRVEEEIGLDSDSRNITIIFAVQISEKDYKFKKTKF